MCVHLIKVKILNNTTVLLSGIRYQVLHKRFWNVIHIPGRIWNWKPISCLCLLCKKKTNIPNLGFINQIWFSIFAYNLNVNPIQDGGRQKVFPPVTSTDTEINPQNFLTFSFNSYATLAQNFKFVPSTSLKLLNLNQNHPSRKVTFLVTSSKISPCLL